MTTRSCRMSSSTTTSASCSASIAALNFGATRLTNARFASPHDVQIHRASSSDSRLRCAPKTRMTAPNGSVEVGSLLVEAIVPAGEASTVEELTCARVAYLHAAHSPEPTSRDPVLDVRISRVDRLAASCTHRDSCSISMRDILPVPGTFGPASLWIPPGRLDLSRGATRRSERIALGSLRSAIAGAQRSAPRCSSPAPANRTTGNGGGCRKPAGRCGRLANGSQDERPASNSPRAFGLLGYAVSPYAWLPRRRCRRCQELAMRGFSRARKCRSCRRGWRDGGLAWDGENCGFPSVIRLFARGPLCQYRVRSPSGRQS